MNLYVEHRNGVPLTPREQCGIVFSSELREATPQEIEDSENYYKEHGKCKYHLIYDKPGFDFDMRYCGICGQFISLI